MRMFVLLMLLPEVALALPGRSPFPDNQCFIGGDGKLAGDLLANGNGFCIDSDGDSCWEAIGDNDLRLTASGATRLRLQSNLNFFVSTNTLNMSGGGYIYSTAGPLELGADCTAGASGDVCVAAAFTPARLTADPCGTYPEGSMFYNNTDDMLCYCNGSGAAVRTDGVASCF